MTWDEDRIVALACDLFGVRPRDLLVPARCREVSNAKAMIAWWMIANTETSYRQVACRLGLYDKGHASNTVRRFDAALGRGERWALVARRAIELAREAA